MGTARSDIIKICQFKMNIFNEKMNHKAIRFYQFFMVGYFALSFISAPLSWNFLSWASVFVALWADRFWFEGCNATALVNYCFGIVLCRAWQNQVGKVNANPTTISCVWHWTAFVLFAIQFLNNFFKNL